ncbi:MAG: ligase-associated DNA damage response DEXH box helicase [Bacteroidetes bacterium]|nr:ligase-associated DNA damage response DEXH box helicase [Bacteroidota bacterium]
MYSAAICYLYLLDLQVYTVRKTKGYQVITSWLEKNKKKAFLFQEQTWQALLKGNSGLVNAPTGYGKTFSVFLGMLIQFINDNPENFKSKKNNGLQLVWVTPLRALGKDIARAMEEVITELGLSWQVGIRNGDTAINERQKQKRSMPEILIITPESLHLLLAQKEYPLLFKQLKVVAVDEWHELLGSKRGVLVELALSRIIGLHRKVVTEMQNDTTEITSAFSSEKSFNPPLIWGISATIGNLDEAKNVLLAPLNIRNETNAEGHCIIKADIKKSINVIPVLPDEIEKYPWAGHLGLNLAEKVLPIINNHKSSLVFINTRGMSERWYQQLLNLAPDLAGALALHHGSIELDLRLWVEEALHAGTLAAVVCTSSLDLGVDFRPVEAVVQVGSPKGVGRFLQRAGRSGHQPDATSNIWFLPTHSLELLEAAALKEAISLSLIESRQPFQLCFDVLIQYLCTLAISEGFYPEEILEEVKNTYCYRHISNEEWRQVLQFITEGGVALQQYDDFKKVEILNGLYRITSRRTAMRHRMHIGTIVSAPMLKVKFITGGYIGVIEEYFISRLIAGDVFTLAGRNLEFIMIKDMTVLVKKSSATKSIVPSWDGGRMPLSANLGFMLRKKLSDVSAIINKRAAIPKNEIEIKALLPLFKLQEDLSYLPKENELLIEHIETKDGFHVFVYPFEGRLVHEAMAALLAYRISRILPITFSFAMNDYGFELLSDQPIPIDDSNAHELFSEENLYADIQKSVNASEMARRKFRDIAVIGGLIFQGMPGQYVKQRHLQSSASLLFNVFSEYEPNNLLLRQAYNEVMDQQMEEQRLRNMLQRIKHGKIVISFPKQLTPFCFPIKVDSMREQMTSEKLEDRIRKMQQQGK